MKKTLLASTVVILGLTFGARLAWGTPITFINDTNETIVNYAFSEEGRNAWLGVSLLKDALMTDQPYAHNAAVTVTPVWIAPGQSFVMDVPDRFERFDLRLTFSGKAVHQYLSLENSDLHHVRLMPRETVFF